jgi:dTDP-4-dehydrorhamnose 3,5-epimerase
MNMKIEPLQISGTFQITLVPIGDNRGFFMRTYDRKEFIKWGMNRTWMQENHSCSLKKGVIRGLHFQMPPYTEAKLVRCIRGRVLDVFVDLRRSSQTFGQWSSLELSQDNKAMVFIPRGFAHGFCTLTENSEVLYKVDNVYAPDHERGLAWNDPDLAIPWPVDQPILSERDSRNMSFREFLRNYKDVQWNIDEANVKDFH